MVNESRANAAQGFALLRFRGPDARKFLQGQLSNDMALLAAERVTLAGFHNPQGRVLALLRLLAPDAEQVIALLPAELAEPTMGALRRYVLRAKVTITHESSAEALAALTEQWPVLAPALTRAAHARDIAAGMPQVYGATSGLFVAQMLNLDCVEAISFTKGCYTGQEIIARAHYRGRIKRRMQRFLTDEPAALAPGQGVTLSDGRTAQIVDAVHDADGRSEFLAVAPLLPDIATAPETPPGAAERTGGEGARLACRRLPLPYALPQ
jgi:folate-binding protein YgfZ